MFQQVVASGAKGITVGRNVWSQERIADVLRAIKAVVHEGREPRQAMQAAGLT
jgi:DhnA family fructose-bisphosphate aldolase class Ia